MQMTRSGLHPTTKASNSGCKSAVQTSTEFLLLLLTSILISGCSAVQGQPVVALALDDMDQPYRTGVEIAKPTYTPFPTEPSAPTPIQPTTTTIPLPAHTPTQAVFAEDAFVVIENLSAPAAAGYDNTSPYDSSPTYNGTKYILVDISEQHMYVYEGDKLVHSFVASTGIGNSTRVGTFSVLNKIPNAYGATWNIWMPNWLGIYWSGSLQNGIHALPILPNGATLWAGYLGTPVSYGCVVLGTYDAQVLYDWADIGTPVEIRW